MYNEEYEDLNIAKKRILYLMKLQYSDENEYNDDYEATIDENVENGMNDIIKKIKLATGTINELSSLVSRHGSYDKPYFKGGAQFILFNKLIFELLNNLKNINDIFKKIINNIGYVEPNEINEFKESIKSLYDYFMRFINLNTYQGKISFSVVSTDKTDKRSDLLAINTIKDTLRTIQEEVTKIINYNNTISSNYNYKSVNIKNKPKVTNYLLSKKEKLVNQNSDDIDNNLNYQDIIND